MAFNKEDNPSDPGNIGKGNTTPATAYITYSVDDK